MIVRHGSTCNEEICSIHQSKMIREKYVIYNRISNGLWQDQLNLVYDPKFLKETNLGYAALIYYGERPPRTGNASL
jgi:hypothetical protein